MPYDEGTGGYNPSPATQRRTAYLAPYKRGPSIVRRGTGSDFAPLSVERAIELAPGIRPEVIRSLYARGITIRQGLVSQGRGGVYNPTTRQITIRADLSANRVVPSLINPSGFSRTTFGTRGTLEHELRHASQHLLPMSLAQYTNPTYRIGRETLIFGERIGAGNLLGAIPYIPSVILGGGRTAAEKFANYGESGYGMPALAPSAYAPFHTNVQSNKSITAGVDRLTGLASRYFATQ